MTTGDGVPRVEPARKRTVDDAYDRRDIEDEKRGLRIRRTAVEELDEEQFLAAIGDSRQKRNGREFLKVPPAIPIMDKILAAEVNLLGGPAGASKSLLMRDWCLSVASGVPWRGHAVVTARNVLVIASEGLHDFAERWETHPLWDSAADHLYVLDGIVNLTSSRDVAWLLEEYSTERPGLVAFDVIYGMGMADDNGSKDVLPVLSSMKEISKEWEAATLALGHPPHNGGRRFRGSSMWNQLAYTEWHMADNMLSCEKSKLADRTKLSAQYTTAYPTINWTSSGEVLATEAKRRAVVAADLARFPGESARSRGRRLAETLDLKEDRARKLVASVQKELDESTPASPAPETPDSVIESM